MSSRKICHSDNDYTANLYCAVFKTPEDEDDYNPRRILDALNTLTERERRVLECRFKYAKTLEHTAEEIGCGRERARQIESKALRKLRHPSRMRDMSVSQIEKERDGYKQKVVEQEAVINELRRQITHLTNGFAICNELTVPIDKLEWDVSEMGLSVRSYNCLWRAGLKKVRDVYELQSSRELHGIRNLGKKSCEEVIYRMRDMGFSDWADKMSNYSND